MRKRIRKGIRRISWVVAVVSLLLLLSRNWIAREIAQRAATLILGAQVELDHVSIGLGNVHVRGITLLDPAFAGQPQLTVEQVDIVTSFGRGFRCGIWFDSVVISQPTLHARFDAAGELISQFPQSGPSSEGPQTIPLRSLVVTSGQVIIHQGDQQTAVVTGAALEGVFGDSIRVRGKVTQALGGKVAFESLVDAASLEGHTSLRIEACRFDNHQLPGRLLPAPLRDEAISGTLECTLQMHHPAGESDLWLHPAAIEIRLCDLAIAKLDNIINQLTISGTLDRDSVTVNVDADPLGGNASLRVIANSLVPPLEASVESELNDCQIHRFMELCAPEIDLHALGRINTTSRVQWDGNLLSFAGNATSIATDISVDQIAIDDVNCKVECHGNLPLGFGGPGPIASLRGRLSGSITSDGLDLRKLAKRFAIADLNGRVSGSATFQLPLDHLGQVDFCESTAVIRTENLLLAGEAIDDMAIRCELREGNLTVPSFPLTWRDNVCQIDARGHVTDQLKLEGQFSTDQIRLADVADVASRFSKNRLPLSGHAELIGSFGFETKSLAYQSAGTARLVDSFCAGTKVGSAALTWEANQSGLRLSTHSQDFLGGSYTVTANARELDWTRAMVELQFNEMQTSRAAELFGLGLPIEGTLEGGCRVTSLGRLEDLQGLAWVRSRGLSVQRIPIELNSASINIGGGRATATAGGQILRGRFSADASCDLNEMQEFAKNELRELRNMPLAAQAKLDRLSIEEAIQAGRLPKELRPLAGVVSVRCVRDESTTRDGLLCTASVTTENLQWKQARLSERITTTIQLHPNRVELASINGRFADGQLSGRGEVSLSSEPKGFFQIGANRMNLRLAAAPLGNVVNGASGTGSLRLDGRIGRTITGRADISANHASVSNLDVRAIRLPIDWAFTPATGNMSWRCRAGVVEAGDGKINLSSEGDYSRSLNMRMAASVHHIDTARLMRGKSISAGIVDGQVNLQAKRARTSQQLAGNFDFRLSQVDSLQMPVLDQLYSVVKLTPSMTASQSNDGRVRGRLAGGMVHLDQFMISQSNVQVVMNGNTTLDGRLDFDVTAATGETGPAEGLLALANSPLMLAAPAPIALVVKANEAMKDRVVHVHVGGTASRPTFRLQPGKQLSQDTLRFFLTSSFGSQVANAADTSRRQSNLR